MTTTAGDSLQPDQILATAHKVPRTILAMSREQCPYIDPGIDYAKLLVDRNAAHWLRKLDQHSHLERIRSGGQPMAA